MNYTAELCLPHANEGLLHAGVAAWATLIQLTTPPETTDSRPQALMDLQLLHHVLVGYDAPLK